MPSLQWQFHPDYQSSDLKAPILAIFSGKTEKAETVEGSDYARVCSFRVSLNGVERTLYYKEFLFRGLRDRISVLFRPSRARRAWRGGYLLQDHGIGTAAPVCVGQWRILGVVTRSFLVTEAVAGALEIEEYLRAAFGRDNADTWVRKRAFLRHLGRTVGRMHRLGIFQGDLRERNILIGPGDPPGIYFIDNERTRRFSGLPDARRLKNLVQLNMNPSPVLTRTDRVRFFYAYLEENPGLFAARKEWLARILAKTRMRLRKKDRIPS